jgi:hypothetical protein
MRPRVNDADIRRLLAEAYWLGSEGAGRRIS